MDDRTDDILPDDQLYNWLCTATLRLREESALNHEFVTTLIEALLEGYEGPVPDAKERLSHALTIMLLNVAAAALMQEADALMAREVSPDESRFPGTMVLPLRKTNERCDFPMMEWWTPCP